MLAVDALAVVAVKSSIISKSIVKAAAEIVTVLAAVGASSIVPV